MKNKKKIFVAMSGGVDSSVSAAVLKDSGHDVTGVFIKVWQPAFLECSWKDERRDAMRVCAKLGISFKTLNLEEEYEREIVEYMVSEYKKGRTPNPDVMCNKHIKFGAFLAFAKSEGADMIATGHYAQIAPVGTIWEARNPKSEIRKIKQALLSGRDKNKDQSYFLWTLTQGQLKHILFPVGGLKKEEVRELARKFELPVHDKKDSQGLCFIGEVNMREFLEHYIPSKRGNVLNEEGDVIGWHEGAFYFTLGQRHGFTVVKKSPNGGPYYVISKNIDKNTLTVSCNKGSTFVEERGVEIGNVNWISGSAPDVGKKYSARIRYRQPLEDCRLSAEPKGGRATVTFDNPQKAVAPGQSLVLYDGEKCLGGGVIV